MIVPVGINHVIRGWPWATIALILACTLVHIYGSAMGPSPEEVQAQMALRLAEMPDEPDAQSLAQLSADIERLASRLPTYRFGYTSDEGLSYRLLTSAFIHADWFHLIGNMLFLWLAGAALEDRWGRARFLGFYAAGAAVSALGFGMLHGGDPVMLVGASGAISALMGAFLVCFARTHIYFVYWFGRSIGRFDASAYIALPLWFAEQLVYGLLDGGGSGVAFTAHVTGFVFGLAVALVARQVVRARAAATERADQSPPLPRAVARQSAPAIRPPAPPPPEPPRPVIVEPATEGPPAEPGSGPRFLT